MITKKFKEEYARLNPKQKEAVDMIEGPVMVIAGPGTGKTTILTLRIANILKMTDTPASGILALTFTEAGAKAMRAKLREIIGDLALEVPIHTFHGFAKSVIDQFQDHFPHLSRSKQITDIESEKLIREILKEKRFGKLRPLGEPDFYVYKILETISDCKQEAWTPEMLKDFAKDEIEKIKSQEKLKATDLKRIQKCERTILFSYVYGAYEKKKKGERKMDFDDLIFELLKALHEDKLLLQILQEKYLYILVDEHQDTNDSQNLIVRRLADFFESPNLFVVGDEKQAIYRFQGASVENFLSFQKAWGGMKIISLEQNFRSHQRLLDAVFKMIEQNYGGKELMNLRIKLKSGNKGKDPLDLISASDIATEESYLLKKLRELVDKKEGKTVAIIVRRNSDVSNILATLEANNIKASAERGTNIFEHPLGALFFSLLEFLHDTSNTEALAQTFAGGLWNLNFEKQVELIKFVRSGNIGNLGKAIPAISALEREISRSGAIEYLALAADVSGLTDMVSERPVAAEVWRTIFELAKNLTETNSIEDPHKLIGLLLAYRKSAEKKTIKIKTGGNFSQITVMTAHGSKGLEFDYVFLPYAVEESWITKNRGSYFVLPKEKEEGDSIRDERRLFYVSLTRAREHVSISFSLEDGQGGILTPLRFINELDARHVKETIIPKMASPRIIQSIENKKIKRENEKIEYAKSVLLENGLSVTALNHFMNCPSEFFYKSILKLPEPPTASSEKGNAMHEALSNVWRNLTSSPSPRSRRGEKEIESIIISSVKNYFKHSLLASFEKEIILEELISNASKVALALADHFNQSDLVKTENWVEIPFEYKNIQLKLHGKLDAVIEKENKILVYDYKTREAMSVNAIKGETKNSDGNYFRQLVFYKMLLEDPERSRRVGKTIEPALVFVKPDSKGRCPTISLPIENSDIEKVKLEIESLIESVWSGTLLIATCSNPTCKYCNLKKLSL